MFITITSLYAIVVWAAHSFLARRPFTLYIKEGKGLYRLDNSRVILGVPPQRTCHDKYGETFIDGESPIIFSICRARGRYKILTVCHATRLKYVPAVARWGMCRIYLKTCSISTTATYFEKTLYATNVPIVLPMRKSFHGIESHDSSSVSRHREAC